MATHPLRLLRLPYVIQKIIVPQIDFVNLIELSIVSSKFKKILELIKISVEEFEFYFSQSNTEILVSKDSVTHGIEFDFLPEQERMEKMTRHLLSFMKVQDYELRLERSVDLTNSFIWDITRKFEIIRFESQSSELLEVSSNELKFLLDEIEVQYLQLYIRTNDRGYSLYQFPTESKKKYEYISFGSSSWIDLNTLKNLNSKEIVFSTFNKPTKQANNVLKQWVDGNYSELEIMTIRSGINFEKFQEKIFNGIETEPDEFGGQSLHGHFVTHDAAFKIRRKIDGQEATVAFSWDNFHLVVWNENNLKKFERE